MGDKYGSSLDLVFPNGYGGIMIPHNITKRSFKKYLVQAGLSVEGLRAPRRYGWRRVYTTGNANYQPRSGR